MKKQIIGAIIGAIIIAGGSFYTGLWYEKNQAAQQQPTGRSGNFSGMRRGIQGNGFTGGEIVNKDDASVTVKTNDGGSKIIFFSPSTRILESTQGSTNDLVVGKQITANGTQNPDGSISAQSIQIRPNFPEPKQNRPN